MNACFYSHWHPDHTMGRRVWESINMSGRGVERRVHTTDVYLPEQVAIDFRKTVGNWDHLQFEQSKGLIRIHVLQDDESVTIDGVTVTPVKLANGYVYAFLVQDDSAKALIAMDELKGWMPSPELAALDLGLAQLPIGMFEFHPLTGERHIPADDPILREEATFTETLEIARALNTRQVVFSHIEALDELSHDELLLVAERLHADGLPVTIAYDGLRIDLSRS